MSSHDYDTNRFPNYYTVYLCCFIDSFTEKLHKNNMDNIHDILTKVFLCISSIHNCYNRYIFAYLLLKIVDIHNKEQIDYSNNNIGNKWNSYVVDLMGYKTKTSY